jgi:hypothetical protein
MQPPGNISHRVVAWMGAPDFLSSNYFQQPIFLEAKMLPTLSQTTLPTTILADLNAARNYARQPCGHADDLRERLARLWALVC